MWLNDPDGTAHANGIGAAAARGNRWRSSTAASAASRTRCSAKGLLDRTNIIVTSDHGFSTHTGELRLAALVEPFADDAPTARRTSSSPKARSTCARAPIRRGWRRSWRRCRSVPRSARSSRGRGASGGARRRASCRARCRSTSRAGIIRASGDILVSANWTRPRRTTPASPARRRQSGVAGHGSSSPYDIHNTLIAAGPDFREHAVSDVPTANVDIAPTLLHLLHLKVPEKMTGRVIEEALRNGVAPASVHVAEVREVVRTPDGSYQLVAHFSTAAGRRLLDYTDVRRK